MDLNFKNLNLIEDTIDKESIRLIKENFSSFPFHWESSTREIFPYYSHRLICRDETINETTPYKPTSKLLPFFYDIMHGFCQKHDIVYKNIIRACLNNTYHIPNYEYQDPHLDAKVNHLIVIIYLNNSHGNTVIFDKVFDPITKITQYNVEDIVNHFDILAEIPPKEGKIVCFSGKYFHTIRSPLPGEHRSICIFNLLL